MLFKYGLDMLLQANKAIAKIIFVVGLMLMGFGLLIFILKDIFAALAAGIFIVAGLLCCGMSVKICWRNMKMRKSAGDDFRNFRKNVKIHNPDDDSV